MNKVILIGRLARDSDERTSGEGRMVLRNSLAVDRRFKSQGEGQATADFIPIVAFGKTAEFISNYFSKGKKIAIVGRIQTGSYENAEGRKIYTTDVIVEEVEFVESKRAESEQYEYSAPAAPATSKASQTNDAPAESADGYFPIDDDDDLPF